MIIDCTNELMISLARLGSSDVMFRPGNNVDDVSKMRKERTNEK